MVFKSILSRNNKPGQSVLDLPVEQYDATTRLPERVQIASYAVKPLVKIADVRDHLTLLAAFSAIAEREGAKFGRFASTAAQEYEYWALSVVPARARRAANRNVSGSGSVMSNGESESGGASPSVSRRSSGPAQHAPTAISLATAFERTHSEPAPSSGTLATPTTPSTSRPRPLALALPLTLHPPSHPQATATSPTLVQSPTGLSPFSSVSSLPSSPASESHNAQPKRRRSPLSASELPPLPVLMAWHAHLLHPAQYAADTVQGETYAALSDVPFPLAEAATAIRAGTLPTELEHVPEVRSSSISGWRVPDISAAMQRQARIVGVVRDLGWLDDAFVNGPIAPFQRAIVRYHCWLDLFAATKAHRLAPTMDIELVWRTHELRGGAYRHETELLLGHPLDQADRGSDDLLRNTGALWHKRFGHDYVEAPKRGGPFQPGFRRPIRRSTV